MEFTDPFDWPATMPELRTIDNLLRCGICCEFLNIAMILPKCSHNYCSQCIRRYMNYKSQCPACNTPAIEGEIRNNKVVDEIVKNFIQVRPHILKLCKGQSESSNPTSEFETPARSRKDGKRLPKSSDRTPSLTPGTAFAVKEAAKFFTSGTPKRQSELSTDVPLNRSNEENICPSDEDVVIIDEDEPTTPPPPQGSPSTSTSNEATSAEVPSTRSDKSSCPVCGVGVTVKYINSHLDACLKKSSQMQTTTRKKKRKPLPKLVYNIMSDRELRKKLKEYKLCTQGIRKELIRRIQEFTVLYNAQCDSDDPIPVDDVIKYYERMEKIRNKSQPKSTSQAFKLKLEKCKNDEDILKSQQVYMQHHNKQFKNLIKTTKERMKNSKQMPSMENAVSEAEPPSTSKAGVDPSSSSSNTSNIDTSVEALPDKTLCESSEPVTAKAEDNLSISAESNKSDSDMSDFEKNKEPTMNSTTSNEATTSGLECPPLNRLPVSSVEAKDENEHCNSEPASPTLFESASFSEEEFDGSESEQLGTLASPKVKTDSCVNGTASNATDHVEEQTSPVFSGIIKKNTEITSINDVNCSPRLCQEQSQSSNQDGCQRLPQNKLRRKRKTALEHLGAELSNITEDFVRRASKRNKLT